MSTPINHHYVSQCHSGFFFNQEERKIYCYDKERDNFYTKSSTKSLFSEPFSNTRMDKGVLDHKTLEDELNYYFEQDFDRHVRNALGLAEDPMSNDESKFESLHYLACYGLITDVRFPKNKQGVDNAYDALMRETALKIRYLGDEQQAKTIEAELDKRETKYSNVVHYTEIALRRLTKMGELDFVLYYLKTDEVFLLPDCGCILGRDRINDYYNPWIQDVAVVGMPVTDKLFVFATSKKLGGTVSRVYTIRDRDSDFIRFINRRLFEIATKTVATSDETQLRRIISGIQ